MVSIGQTASAYFHAAERCEEQRRINSNQIEWLLIPAVTNRAFCIELYLKAILENDGISKDGHKLSILFKELSEKRQLQIITDIGMTRQNFSIDLTKISDAFVEWRYIYERDDIQIVWMFLQKLSKSVKNVFEDCCKNP